LGEQIVHALGWAKWEIMAELVGRTVVDVDRFDNGN
jgi:hypothetical protein